MSVVIAWILVGIILVAWGIFEFRRYLRRADERVERDLIAETNEEYEEWETELREMLTPLSRVEFDELKKLQTLIKEHMAEMVAMSDEEIDAILQERTIVR